jgi:hypothetical protein
MKLLYCFILLVVELGYFILPFGLVVFVSFYFFCTSDTDSIPQLPILFLFSVCLMGFINSMHLGFIPHMNITGLR